MDKTNGRPAKAPRKPQIRWSVRTACPHCAHPIVAAGSEELIESARDHEAWRHASKIDVGADIPGGGAA